MIFKHYLHICRVTFLNWVTPAYVITISVKKLAKKTNHPMPLIETYFSSLLVAAMTVRRCLILSASVGKTVCIASLYNHPWCTHLQPTGKSIKEQHRLQNCIRTSPSFTILLLNNTTKNDKNSLLKQGVAPPPRHVFIFPEDIR